MSRVQIDSEVWDAICTHYAGLEHPTEQDRAVIAYIADKIGRQVAHDSYMAERRAAALASRQEEQK